MTDVFAGVYSLFLIATTTYLCSKCVCSPHAPANDETKYVIMTQADYDHLQLRLNEKQPLLTAPPEYTPQPTTIQAPTVQAQQPQAQQTPTVQEPHAQQIPTV